jgi:uncharacterized membrane protein
MSLLIKTIITFLSLDFVFLYLMRSMFNNQVIAVQGSPVVMNVYAALLCYAFLIFGIYYFVLREKKSVSYAFLFGLVVYGVYETTTLALFKNWKYTTAIIDTLWGGTLFALTTYIVYAINNK